MKNMDEILDVISNMAKVKMAMNSHKGDISNISIPDLLMNAKAEMVELEEAIRGEEKMMNIIEEAADVLNYLLAAVDKAVSNYRER